MFNRKQTVDGILGQFQKIRDQLLAVTDQNNAQITEIDAQVEVLQERQDNLIDDNARAYHAIRQLSDLVGDPQPEDTEGS